MVSAGASTSSDAALAARAVAALAAKKLALGLAPVWQLHWAQGPSQMQEHLLHLGYGVPSARSLAESAFMETAASKRAAGNADSFLAGLDPDATPTTRTARIESECIAMLA